MSKNVEFSNRTFQTVLSVPLYVLSYLHDTRFEYRIVKLQLTMVSQVIITYILGSENLQKISLPFYLLINLVQYVFYVKFTCLLKVVKFTFDIDVIIVLFVLQNEIRTYIQNNMWSPEYPTLVYKQD